MSIREPKFEALCSNKEFNILGPSDWVKDILYYDMQQQSEFERDDIERWAAYEQLAGEIIEKYFDSIPIISTKPYEI